MNNIGIGWSRVLRLAVIGAVVLSLAGCNLFASAAEKCARVGAHPKEGIVIDGEAVGVAFDKINRAEALKHCRKAVAQEAGPASKYHLARALIAEGVNGADLAEAKGLISEAIAEGYGFAHLGAGYVASSFQPVDGPAAAAHYMKAAELGAGDLGRLGLGWTYLFSPDMAAYRDKGLEILTQQAPANPALYINMAEYHKSLGGSRTNYLNAAEMYKAAGDAGIAQAHHDLGKLYFDANSPLRNIRKARKAAQDAVDLGLVEAYTLLVDVSYESARAAKSYGAALRVAQEGARSQNAHAAYVAGHMHFHAQGVEKNTLTAETYLKQAAALGSEPARKLLASDVTSRANRLRRMPKSNAQNCIKSRVSSYDRNNIDYRNGCDTGLNTLVCSRSVATELWSMFDNKDRESCRRKYVGAGQYIDNFYGANKNSSLLRKAVSNTNVKVGACHPPLMPVFRGSKVFCREQ